MAQRLLMLTVLTALSLLSSQRALAEHERGWACTDAVREYCGDVDSVGDRLLQCLQQHESNLSPACLVASQKAEAHYQEVSTACAGDIANLCQGREGHLLWQCLRANETRLSPSCQALASDPQQEPTWGQDQ